jgi:hypothetical protein
VVMAANTDVDLAAEGDLDDLPRTLRRERDARAREAREREARERQARDREPVMSRTSDPSGYSPPPSYISPRSGGVPVVYGDEPIPAAVTRFDVPFFRLVAFFLKAVIAAVPALILLGVMLWFAGKGLEAYFPELVHMKILVSFPNG